MLLVERNVVKGEIVESDKNNLPKGVLCRAIYNVCNINEQNRNGRIYERSVWENVLKDSEILEKMKNRSLYGQAEHPVDTVQSNLEKTSHVITKMWIEDSTHQVKQEVDVLDTPYGRIVNTLLEAECQVGVSTRAEGEVEEVTEGENRFNRVVPETYRYITTDFTADPSTYGTVPEKVERSLVSQIDVGVKENKIDKEFATLILKNFKTKEASILLESIKEAVDKKDTTKLLEDLKEKYEESIRRMYHCFMEDGYKEEEAIKKIADMLEIPKEAVYSQLRKAGLDLEESEIKGEDSKITDEVIDTLADKLDVDFNVIDRDQFKKGIEVEFEHRETVGGSLEKIARIALDHLRELPDYYTRLAKMEQSGKSEEGSTTENFGVVIDLTKELKKIKLDNAKAVAEKEVLEESYAKLEDSYSKDIVEGTEKIYSIEKCLAEKFREEVRKKATEVKAKVCEMKGSYNTRIKNLEDSYENRIATLEEMHKKALEGVKKEISETSERKYLKKLGEMLIKKSKLPLPEKVQALLEKCSNEEEVVDLIETYRNDYREGLLHSDKLNEVIINKKEEVDTETSEIYRRINVASESLYGKGVLK